MNVRRPEWDEQPARPVVRNARENQQTMLTGVIGPPRSDLITGPTPSVLARQAISAARKSACIGILRPLFFLAALSCSSMPVPISPLGPTIISQVRFEISPALRPAF